MNEYMKNQATPGRKVWGKEVEQVAEPNSRYIAKLERHLSANGALIGTPETTARSEDGREVSTLVGLNRPAENQFIVRILMYYTGMDIAGNLSDEEFVFATLEEATAFIHRKIGIHFDQMSINR